MNLWLSSLMAPIPTLEKILPRSMFMGGLILSGAHLRTYSKLASVCGPGEFTKRAYLNNKLDLVASEGIHTLINASSEQEWLSAKYLLEGKLQKKSKPFTKDSLK